MDLYQQIFYTTFAFAFGLLHSILFLNNRNLKSNFYFAIFAFLYAATIFFDFQATLSINNIDEIIHLRVHRGLMALTPIFILLFVYSLFEVRLPKYFWFISGGLIISGFFAVIEPMEYFLYLQLFQIIALSEINRVMFNAIKMKKEGAWIMTFGFTALIIFSSYDLLMDFGLIEAFYGIHNGYPFGFVVLLISMSINLSSKIAHTNRQILIKERETAELEIQQRLLKIEDARKSKELEEARNLQLSMLPSCDTSIGSLDICFDMKSATEVGGDYYDYHYADDGTVTIVIGDATGHGMKAGVLVSIVKSLFISDEGKSDILSFFQKTSQTIKKLDLGNLYMALMIIKIKDGKITASSAGMPPLNIYRKKTDSVETIVIKGMPLGAFDSFPYKTIETELASGDTVLLMSDGLSESFNAEKEMLDDPQILEAFKEAADKHPTKIVKHLFELGTEWQGEAEQQDDITLLVLKSRKQ